ncbi:MAG: heavy-metal-associated domain-containing protein [Massilibacteroides sp.]|nr:heavy-metal-associated domain-containing protein [Massilibacteroides sp.]MDD3061275.1 heavy-metal-associated domain-containing protein [Massilibacteroides sp.]MDD4114623.1 heavy-metal-associated domain-containing protein [Massilibacteroides sp.]MDD4659772.1 heavy-metal-associated domain-containing protein [Massilibacteroides sp.]
MKRFVLTIIGILCISSITLAQDKPAKTKKETVTFYIENMDCQHCVKKIEKNIAFEKGVTDLICNLSDRTAKVTYNTTKTSEAKLRSAFKKIDMEAVLVGEKPKEKK